MKKFLFAVTIMAIMVFANPAFSLDRGGVKEWTNFNTNPFKKFAVISEKQFERDRQGLKVLGLDSQQIDKIMSIHIPAVVNKVQTDFRWDIIRKGDKFEKMIFGEFHVWHNILTAWNKRVAQVSRVYTLAAGIEIWYPIVCGNWAIRGKKIPPPPAPPFADMGELERAIAKIQQPKEYKWDWDSTWGAFDERYTDGNKVKGWWQSTTLYPVIVDDDEGNEWAFGLNYTTRNWKGKTGEEDPFRYKGDVDIWSLAGRFRDDSRDWEAISRVGLGNRKDKGFLVNEYGRYDMKQKTDILNIYNSVEYSGRTNEKWFSKTRSSLELEFGGKPDDKNAYNISLYSDIYSLNQKKSVQIWAEGRSTYYAEHYRLGNRIAGGLSFWNGSIKVGPGYTHWNSSHADSKGWYGEVSLYNLYHTIVGYPAGDDWDFEKDIEEGY